MTTNEIFGRPVEGIIRPTSERQVDQAIPELFISALDALLDLPGVVEYKWTQYTPYWNDGEECEFGTRADWNAGVKFTFGDEDGGEDEDGHYTASNLKGWNKSEIEPLNGVDVTEHYYALEHLEKALSWGQHNVFLKDTFGDHATVFATKEGFRVEFYDHE